MRVKDSPMDRIEQYDLKKRLKKCRGFLFSAYRLVTLFCIAMILLFPLMYMLSVSLRPSSDMDDPMIVWVPSKIIFTNILETFKIMDYPKAFFNTFSISFLCSVFSIISCSFAGYSLARFKYPGKKVFFAIVLLMLIVPPQNTLMAIFLQYRSFDFFGIGQLIGLFLGKPLTVNLNGSVWSLFLPAIFGAGIRAGLFILIFNKFFSNIPVELEEAAYIDGCGVFRTFFKIMLPNAVSSIITVFLFSFVWYWHDYFFTTMFLPNMKTMSLELTKLSAQLQQALSPLGSGIVLNSGDITVRLQSGCLLTILPLLIIYIILQRFFTEGIERTGIVG